MITDVIVMAGGFGERLWPASSSAHPKQFMAVNDAFSFFQESLRRALALRITGKIVVVTRKDIESECVHHIKNLAEKSDDWDAKKLLGETIVIAEPCPKHTAAAVMTGVELVRKIQPEKKHLFLVLTSDHVITPVENFVFDCKNAACAAENGMFVCFSIVPSQPSTGFGYIKAGVDVSGNGTAFKIEKFEEKPDFETAKKYVESKKYFWNSGMFAFDGDMFLREMKLCTPEVSAAFRHIEDGVKPSFRQSDGVYTVKSWKPMEKTYEEVPAVAVDKAVAEKTDKAAVVRATFSWTDVGSWDTFSELCKNPRNAKVVQVESGNNFVYSDVPVSLCGVKNLVVVAKNGKILIMEKGKSSLVREAVRQIEC